MSDTLTIPRPDDWHLHLRDGALLQAVLPHTAAHFGRAIVMPNLKPPVRTGSEAADYRRRILAALPDGADFTPLMTLYLTEQTDPDDVVAAHRDGTIAAVKLYPAGATTNSDAGVRDIAAVLPVLGAMADAGVPLLVHGEVTDPAVDIFDREAAFIQRVLIPLRARLPRLRVVFEHLTTAEGVAYVLGCTDGGVAATVTPHHLMINRNAIFQGGIRPHYYCLPIAKREHHRRALVDAVTSGDPRFFLGTDSAPHLDPAKESDCGCAGIFNAPNALSCTAEVFEAADALEHLAAFTSRSGPAFYGLPVSERTLTLVRRPAPPTPPLLVGGQRLRVFDPEIPLRWSVAG
jgi:dihydroorotase